MKNLSPREDLQLCDQFADVIEKWFKMCAVQKYACISEIVNVFAQMGEVNWFLMATELADKKRIFYEERQRISHNEAAKAKEAVINCKTAAAQFASPVEATNMDHNLDYSEAEG